MKNFLFSLAFAASHALAQTDFKSPCINGKLERLSKKYGSFERSSSCGLLDAKTIIPPTKVNTKNPKLFLVFVPRSFSVGDELSFETPKNKKRFVIRSYPVKKVSKLKTFDSVLSSAWEVLIPVAKAQESSRGYCSRQHQTIEEIQDGIGIGSLIVGDLCLIPGIGWGAAATIEGTLLLWQGSLEMYSWTLPSVCRTTAFSDEELSFYKPGADVVAVGLPSSIGEELENLQSEEGIQIISFQGIVNGQQIHWTIE